MGTEAMKIDASQTAPHLIRDRGLVAFRSGDLQAAEEAFTQALASYAAAGDDAAQAEMLANLGVVHIQSARYPQAEQELSQAAEQFRKLARRSEEAQAIGNLGTLFERTGDRERAASHYRQAADIFAELGERDNEQATLAALTKVQVGDRKWISSLFTYDRALATSTRLTLKQRLFRWLFKILSRVMKL